MIKKIWIFLLVSLFVFVVPSMALEYQGQTITAQDIQNLPPGTIQSLPPGTMEKVNQTISSEQNTLPAKEILQKETAAVKTEDTTNKLANESEPKENEPDKNKPDEIDADIKKLSQDAPDSVSIIEQQYRQGYSSTLSSNLKQFGYDFFTSAKMQQSSLAVPDPAYTLGTGDQLLIRLWGSNVDAEYAAIVDREGKINVPKIGMVHLAGVKYGDVESIILKEAEKYIQGINLSVSLTKLRSLEVYVVGAVNNPGLHIVPSFSTILDGLQMAGGVKKSGTLRQIKLNRAKKLIKILDVYDLLLKGNRGADEILQNKDVIFVPGIGKTAAVAGAVNNEGIFELAREKNVQDLLRMSGGLLPQAFGPRIYLRRFENNKNFIINDISSHSIKGWNKIGIQNGDLLELTFSSFLPPKVVRLEGHVWSPDVFQFKKGMKLSNILTSPALLKPDSITDFGLIYRYDAKTTRVTPMQFPLSKVFTGEYDARLYPFDKIQILSRANAGISENFSIIGAVWKPGEYEYRKGLKLKDALALSGGLMPEARTDRIEIARKIKTATKFETEYIKLDITKNYDFILKPDDKILIPKLEDYFVSLEGHVWFPKKMQYHTGMKLSDVLISKDLPKPEDIFKPDVLMAFGLIYRYNSKTTRTTAIRFPLANVFNGTHDEVLQPFDRIQVLSRKDLGIEEKFSITGSVWKEGEFEYQPGLRLKDALALAGGVKFGARTNKVEIARQSIKGNWMQTQYIVLNLNKDGDFILKPYDSVLIPGIKNASLVEKVTITGEVAYPGTYTIRQGEKVSDLIQRAGGFSEYAYFYGAKYTSQKARIIQQKSIDQMIEKLKLSIMQTTSGKAQTALDAEDVKAAELTGEATQSLLDQLTSIKAEGRISIKLADLISFKDSLYDFRLKHEDTIDIPSKPSFISVVGSVYSPGSFLYEPNQSLKFYLSKSGGIAKTADEDYMYVLKANGEIKSMSQNNGFFSKFVNTTLMPGDTIVVPENLERIGYLKLISDISDIVFKIATTAGVAVALSL
ncbi:MAG: hypothetical protein HN417_07055 [Desulfobacula sp.]|nr:hypothetical protein [Desulfobacula sp.]